MRTLSVLLCTAVVLCDLASAQTLRDRIRRLNIFRDAPEVGITVEHPPRLGLQVDSVVFAAPDGECGEEFLDALLADFVSNGVKVTDRSNLESLLSEHEFTLSGVVDSGDALELGKISGADALVIAKVRRCAVEQPSPTYRTVENSDGSVTRIYTASTKVSFRATVQVIDLTTARVFSAQTIEEEAFRSNEAHNSAPSPPSRFNVIDDALRSAVTKVHRLFFPWTQYKKLNYYDDSQCSLKIAYRLMQAGDLDGALDQSVSNVRVCEGFRAKKPKLLARALYNLGVTQLLLDRFEEARETLEESLRLNPTSVTSTTMAEARGLERLAREVDAAEASGKMRPRKPSLQKAPAAQSSDDELVAKLGKLKSLFEKGLISKEVYDERVGKLLDSLE